MLYRQRSTIAQRPATRRRIAQLLTLTLILLGLAPVLPAGALATADLSAQSPATLVGTELTGVAFANANYGWAVGIPQT